MPSLPVFASPAAQSSRDRDPDSKRFRGGPLRGGRTGRWRLCCGGGMDVQWLAAGFVLGMLVFAGLSAMQGSAGPLSFLYKGTEEHQPVQLDPQPAEGATQNDEVLVLDGGDGQFRDAEPGWEEGSDAGGGGGGGGEEAASADQQPQKEAAQQPGDQNEEQQQQQEQPEQPEQLEEPEQAGQEGGEEQPAADEEAAQAEQQNQQQGQQAQQQQRQQEPRRQQGTALTAMEKLHGLGIRYHEREPGTPAVGGNTFLPPGNWGQRGQRRILIYLGGDEGAELNYIIDVDRDQRQKEYDLAFVFEPRPDHNTMWEIAVGERSNPAVEYINKAAWWRNTVLDFGNNDRVGSVLRTKHNDFADETRTIQVQGIDFAEWVRDYFRDNDHVTLVSDIQGAEFPVFSHLADSGLARRINTLYLECHYEAHAALIEAITEDSCRELCNALVPHVPNFYFWVGPNQDGRIVRGFEFVDQPGLRRNDCDSLHFTPPADGDDGGTATDGGSATAEGDADGVAEDAAEEDAAAEDAAGDAGAAENEAAADAGDAADVVGEDVRRRQRRRR